MLRQRKSSFKSKVESELEILNKNSGRLTRFFTEDRHAETIRGMNEYNEDREIWRKYSKDRMKTVSVALVFCLHIGVDPPDPIPKPNPCAKLEGWVDPFSCNPQRALTAISEAVRKSYERWQPRARYKVCTDPTSEDVRKLCLSMRRNAKEERVLFHYNGHGVPRPTSNGEIWVFNKNYTQYIPLSLYDLQGWIDYPAIYVWDCNSAETIVKTFSRYVDDSDREYLKNLARTEGEIPSGVTSDCDRHNYHDCIQLAACGVDERLPTNPLLPADLFTACLTTPIQTSILTYLIRTGRRSQFPENITELIPGHLSDRKSPLGELNWIFTAITDTIAWNRLPKEVFQRLFRQDLLLASLFRSYILAEKIMGENGCRTISVPKLEKTSDHPLWESWDYTLDQTLSYLYNSVILPKQSFDYYAFPKEPFGKDIIYAKSNFCGNKVYIDVENLLNSGVMEHKHNWFFVEQLTAFEVWLEYCADKENKPPQQLPIVLQVLLSQAHRLRALELLARFLDLGQWAVIHALAVGVFPYVQKLLQSNTRELRPWLAFIWAKILAVDPSCQTELFKENGDDAPRYDMQKNPKVLRYYYFIQILNDPETTAHQKIVPAFILATLFHNNYQVAQGNLTQKGYVNLCTELLGDPAAKNCRLLKLWVLIGLGRLWADYDPARWQAVRLNAHPKIDQELCDVLCNKCSLDGSCLVRIEVAVALQWYITDFEKHFVKVLLAIVSKLNIALENFKEDNFDEGLDIANVMGKPNRSKNSAKPSEQFFQTLKPVPNNTPREESFQIDQNVVIHEDAWVSATPAEDEFRLRCQEQIYFLQSKTFLESNERVWLSMLLLAVDPHIKVASMAKVMVRRVEQMAVDEIIKTQIKLRDRSGADLHAVHRQAVTSRSVVELSTVTNINLQPNLSSSPHDFPLDGLDEVDHASSPASTENPSSSSVRFTVGSPAVNQSLLNTPETPLAPPVRKLSMPTTSSTPRISSSKPAISEHDRFNRMAKIVIESVYTPKRVTKGELAKHSKSKKTGEGDSHHAVITSDFVEWCSRIFLNPILDVINGNDNEDENGERQIPNVIPTDWAFHTREGLYQTSREEFARLKGSQNLDNVLATIENPGIKCMAMSFLRKIVYMCDEDKVTMLRFEALPVITKTFNVLGSNPYTDDKVCSLKVINDMSKEMLLCGSKKGVIRIWDCHYDVHSHSLDLSRKDPTLVACAMPLASEIERFPTEIEYIEDLKSNLTVSYANKIGFKKYHNRRKVLYNCFYEWRQKSGRLVCGGNSKVVRVWSAQTERTVTDLAVGTRFGRVTALAALLDHTNDEMIAVGFRSGALHVHDLRAVDHKQAVLRNEERLRSIVGCTFNATTCTAVDQGGYVFSLDLRMFSEPFNEYQLPGVDETFALERHDSHRELTAYITRPYGTTFDSKSDSIKARFIPHTECKLFDTTKNSFGTISSHYSGSQSNVNCIAMHKRRMTLFKCAVNLPRRLFLGGTICKHTFAQPERNTRSLDVAVIGAPNGGKSLLTNQLIRAAVCAVSSKMDTTLQNTDCVLTEDDVQLCIVDSPGTVGLKHATSTMGRNKDDRIVTDPEKALSKAEHILVVQDVTQTGDYIHHRVLHLLHRHSHLPCSLVLNKIDLIRDRKQLLELTRILCNGQVAGQPIQTTQTTIGRLGKVSQNLKLHNDASTMGDERWQIRYKEIIERPPQKVPYNDTKQLFMQIRGWSNFKAIFFVSSLTGEGVDDLRNHLKILSEKRVWKHDSTAVTNKSPQELCINSIRAALLDTTPSNVAYSLKPKILDWNEEGEHLYILAEIPCEKEREARLIVGKEGQRVSEITRRVKDHMHTLFQKELALDINVKCNKKEYNIH